MAEPTRRRAPVVGLLLVAAVGGMAASLLLTPSPQARVERARAVMDGAQVVTLRANVQGEGDGNGYWDVTLTPTPHALPAGVAGYLDCDSIRSCASFLLSPRGGLAQNPPTLRGRQVLVSVHGTGDPGGGWVPVFDVTVSAAGGAPVALDPGGAECDHCQFATFTFTSIRG